jgi:hypothetical protein
MRKAIGSPVTPEQRGAAYHEAGHAVARYHLSGAGRSIGIGCAGERSGRDHRPTFGRPPLVLPFGEALDRIQVCLAGSIAERRATGRVDRAAREVDRAEAAETALRISFEPETDAMLRWLALRTEHLVEFYWADVDAVARALLERRSLTAREVAAAIRTTQAGRQPPPMVSSRPGTSSESAPRPLRASNGPIALR